MNSSRLIRGLKHYRRLALSGRRLCRTSTDGSRIIITGTGRAGTTFLVQLMTALSFDTGYTLEEALQNVDGISLAGLERPLVSGNNPYVIKSPWFADDLERALEGREISIRAAVIPVRNLVSAAESRRRVYREAVRQGLDPKVQPGSLSHTDVPAEQESRLAQQFFKAVYPLVRFEIPIFLLHFPRTVEDPEYLYQNLYPLLRSHSVSRREFLAAHSRVAKPQAIHSFAPIERDRIISSPIMT